MSKWKTGFGKVKHLWQKSAFNQKYVITRCGLRMNAKLLDRMCDVAYRKCKKCKQRSKTDREDK